MARYFVFVELKLTQSSFRVFCGLKTDSDYKIYNISLMVEDDKIRLWRVLIS